MSKELNQYRSNEFVKEMLGRSHSTVVGATVNGFLYDEELGGIGGMIYILYVPVGTVKEEIDKAKKFLLASQDVVGFKVIRVKQEWVDELMHTEKKPEGGWIESMRWIVEHKQSRKIDAEGSLIPDNKVGGQVCDLSTASLMLGVYDNLNDKNKERFGKMSFAAAYYVAMAIVEKIGTK